MKRMTGVAAASFLFAGCASMEGTGRETSAAARGATRQGPHGVDPAALEREPEWGEGSGKSYVVPAVDIIGFEFLLNQFDRHIYDDDGDFDSDLDSIEDN